MFAGRSVNRPAVSGGRAPEGTHPLWDLGLCRARRSPSVNAIRAGSLFRRIRFSLRKHSLSWVSSRQSNLVMGATNWRCDQPNGLGARLSSAVVLQSVWMHSGSGQYDRNHPMQGPASLTSGSPQLPPISRTMGLRPTAAYAARSSAKPGFGLLLR